MIPRFLEEAVYGRMPQEHPAATVELVEEGAFLEAWRRQFRITLSRSGRSSSFVVLAYVPRKGGSFPVVLSPNLNGNRSVVPDEAVLRSTLPPRPRRIGVPEVASRAGAYEEKLSVRFLLSCGYGVVTFHHDEAEPDRVNESGWGVRQLYPDISFPGWGALSAWAWSTSRVMDALVYIPEADPARVCLYGFSRAGKSVLLAAASDSRFAGAIAEASGKLGAALSSSRKGESLRYMAAMFPHWFGTGFQGFAFGRGPRVEDQDALLAAAQCPLLILTGKEDAWADPAGQREAVTRANGYSLTRSEFLLRPGGHVPRIQDWESCYAFLDTVAPVSGIIHS